MGRGQGRLDRSESARRTRGPGRGSGRGGAAGTRLDSATIGWHGVEGDRRLAFRRVAERGAFPWLTARNTGNNGDRHLEARSQCQCLLQKWGQAPRSSEPVPLLVTK